MNFLTDIEYSLIILLAYILVRSSARSRFTGSKGRGTGIVIILLGIILIFLISFLIGIIVIFLGLALTLIPEKEDNKIKVEK